MTASQPFTRHDVSFSSGDSTCTPWLRPPTGVASPSVIVLEHGLGATREMRVDACDSRPKGHWAETLSVRVIPKVCAVTRCREVKAVALN